jgi:hypothetical protein
LVLDLVYFKRKYQHQIALNLILIKNRRKMYKKEKSAIV